MSGRNIRKSGVNSTPVANSAQGGRISRKSVKFSSITPDVVPFRRVTRKSLAVTQGVYDRAQSQGKSVDISVAAKRRQTISSGTAQKSARQVKGILRKAPEGMNSKPARKGRKSVQKTPNVVANLSESEQQRNDTMKEEQQKGIHANNQVTHEKRRVLERNAKSLANWKIAYGSCKEKKGANNE